MASFYMLVLFVAIIADKKIAHHRKHFQPPCFFYMHLLFPSGPTHINPCLHNPQANVEKILHKFDQDGSTACFPQSQAQSPSLTENDHSDDDTALIIRREQRTLATATTATQSYTLVGGSLGLEGLARYMPHSSARGVSWAPRYLLAAHGAKL